MNDFEGQFHVSEVQNNDIVCTLKIHLSFCLLPAVHTFVLTVRVNRTEAHVLNYVQTFLIAFVKHSRRNYGIFAAEMSLTCIGAVGLKPPPPTEQSYLRSSELPGWSRDLLPSWNPAIHCHKNKYSVLSETNQTDLLQHVLPSRLSSSALDSDSNSVCASHFLHASYMSRLSSTGTELPM